MAHLIHRQPFFRLWLLLLGCAVAWLGGMQEVHACSCTRNTSIVVWPDGKQPVPTNTQVWIRLPAYNTALPYEKYSDFKGYPQFWSTRFLQNQLALLIADPKNNKYLPLIKTDLTIGQWRMSILRPQSPLLPKHRYEVHMHAPGGLRAVLGAFTTSSQAATDSLPQPGVLGARYIWERQVPDQCRPPGPFAVLDLKQTSVPASSVYGIWLAGADGAVNYKQPPNLILRPKEGRLFLGQASPCAENNFIFPQGGQRVHLGVRVGSLAGNWGPPQQVSFAARVLLAPWSWSPNARVAFWIALGALILLLGFVRTWLFQQASFKIIDEFLAGHDSVKSDMSWIALKQLVQRENKLRRNNFILLSLQILLCGLGAYVFIRQFSHFSISPTALSELYLVVAIVGVVLLLHAVIHLFFTFKIRTKRRKVSALPMTKIFEDSSHELLARWR